MASSEGVLVEVASKLRADCAPFPRTITFGNPKKTGEAQLEARGRKEWQISRVAE